ncbi:MAG TPA: hypothetical protein VKU02_01165 [Gemmataceae bacterium]|nr:hypothetical protein [Gemmataceae bacterium]
MQLSGYGYSRWGAPYQLGRALAHVQRALPDLGVAVCVHETHCQPRQLGKKGFLLSPWQRYTIGRVTRLADLVLPTNRSWQERVIHEYAVPEDRVALLPIGSNIPAVHPMPGERAQQRQRLGWRHSDVVAVVFGSVVSQVQALTRFETLLAQGIQQRYLDRIVCVGGQSPAGVQALDRCHWAQRLGCAEHRLEMLGHRPAREVGQILACADLALAPTPRSLLGKSGVFMAFAAAGLPVIVFEDRPTETSTRPDEWPVFPSRQWQWGLVRSKVLAESGKALQMRYQKMCDWPVIAQRALTLLNEATLRWTG